MSDFVVPDIAVPPAVAHTAAAALEERSRRQGGGTRSAVLAAVELASVPAVPMERVGEIARWHHAHPEAINGRSMSLVAGLFGGRAGREWALAMIPPRLADRADVEPEPHAEPQTALDRLSDRLTAIEDRFRERVHAGAEVAVTHALRHAGRKVAVKAKSRGQRVASLVEDAGGRLTPAVLAAVGLTEQEALDQAFAAYGERFGVEALRAARDQLVVIAEELGTSVDDLIEQWWPRTERNVTEAAVLVVASLTDWATERLADPVPTFDPQGEEPLDGTLPLGVLAVALAAFGGRPIDGPGAKGPGELPPGVRIVIPGHGMIAQVIGGVVGEVRERLTWRVGSPARPFAPHHALNGTTSTYDTLAQDWPSSGWPATGGGYYFPGDHKGDQCTWSTAWELVESALPVAASVA